MRALTDQQMLTAAERRLSDHRATRPATAAVAADMAAGLRRKAEALRADARAIRGLSAPSADAYGRGRDVPATRAEDHRELARLGLEGLRLEQLATSMDLRAEAWERVAARREGDAWRETEAEYVGRVEYYRGRVAAQRVAS
jgi:hypothetical protein